MEKNNKPKVFEIIVDYDDETGMMRNSLVETPAVEIERLAFSKQEEIQQINFSEDSSEQKFISVSMLADTKIPRLAPDGEKYFVVFTKDTIKKIVNKFVMENNINEVSFQHTDEIVNGIYLVEHFILEKGRVESPLFKDVPDGSWVTTYWVKDKEQYESLKNNPEFNGFSIEINAKIEEMFNAHFTEDELVEDNQHIIEINNILDSRDDDKVKRAKIKSILRNLNDE